VFLTKYFGVNAESFQDFLTLLSANPLQRFKLFETKHQNRITPDAYYLT